MDQPILCTVLIMKCESQFTSRTTSLPLGMQAQRNKSSTLTFLLTNIWLFLGAGFAKKILSPNKSSFVLPISHFLDGNFLACQLRECVLYTNTISFDIYVGILYLYLI